jgi:hypothetical protein
MNVHLLGLLLGFFGVPTALMALGHRLRGRTVTHKRRFWGGVYGYILGILIAISFMLLPPVWWGTESPVRTVMLHWAMVVGGGLGILSGPYWARSPRMSR